MRIHGQFSDGHSTRREEAELQFERGQLRVVSASGTELIATTPLKQVRISSRLGHTPRHLYFAGGASFVTDDNAAVDRALTTLRPQAVFVHRLESKWRAIALALLACIGFVFAGLYWGVPALAKSVAFRLPVAASIEAERIAIQVLDHSAFRPSGLDPAERERLHARFQPLLDTAAGDALPLRVEFRDAQHSFGANALALPGGRIIFTDQLVQLAGNDEELLAILAHEIGHIVERHAMRRTVQASALSVFAVLLLGDVSAVAGGAAALPVMLTESGYSRAFEREADRHAVHLLHAHGIAPQRLADILQRLDPDDSGPGYFSTHPPTPERAEHIRREAATLR